MNAALRPVREGTALIGVLLAGGQSRRMGVTKAALRWNQRQTMAEAALEAVRALCTDVVASGHSAGVETGVRRVQDLRQGQGPLAGIEAVLAEYHGDDLLIVTCDMPLIDAALLARLPEPPEGGVSLFDDGSGATEPFPMRLSGAVSAALREWLDSGKRAVRGFVARLPQRRVTVLGDERDKLLNVNREADIALAQRHAGRGSGAPIAAPNVGEMAVISQVRRATEETLTASDDLLAVEAPLELRIGPAPVAVVMRTPGDDEELALGFLLTEGIVDDVGHIASLAHCQDDVTEESAGNVMIALPAVDATIHAAALQRNMYVGSSCGVCGKATIEAVMRRRPALPAEVASSRRWAPSALSELPAIMRGAQRGFAVTGALHAAALFDPDSVLLCAREDVGRHNAVDKVIGWLARRPELSPSALALVVSGRVSFEIVQKALAARIPIVVAVSAPTSLAVQLAEKGGVCVVGFARGKRLNVYSCPERIAAPTQANA